MCKKNICSIIMAVVLSAQFMADASSNRFYIGSSVIEPGKTAILQFGLNNDQDFYGFQVDIALPEGLEILKTDGGEFDMALSRRSEGASYVLNGNIVSDGSLRIGAYSTTHTPFSGNEGELFSIKVNVSSNFTGGDLAVSKILFVNSEDKDVALDPVTLNLKATVYASEISLDKKSLELTEGETATLNATILPGNASDKSVTWSSSDESVTTVSAEGVVTAVKAGTTTITATSSNGKTATCIVTVSAKIIDATEVTLNKTTVELKVGMSETLTATVAPENTTDKTVTWSSSDETVATVDTNGKITAKALGETTITATCGSVKAICKVTVIPTPVESVTLSSTSLSLTEGESAALTATVAPSDATDKSVTWTSSDVSVATVSAEGVVTAVKAGTTTITATSNGKTATCTVSVAAAVIIAESLTITPEIWSGEEGSSFTITATVLPADTSDKSLKFESSDPTVATVDETGNVKLLKEGSCKIIVSTLDGSNLTAECVITSLSGIETIFADSDAEVDVYDMNGILMKRNCSRNELKSLKPSVYILRKGNTIVKAVLN